MYRSALQAIAVSVEAPEWIGLGALTEISGSTICARDAAWVPIKASKLAVPNSLRRNRNDILTDLIE
jgi:hypothetical protein